MDNLLSLLGPSKVRCTKTLCKEGSTMQGSKLYTNTEICQSSFKIYLKTILTYKVKQLLLKKIPDLNLCISFR